MGLKTKIITLIVIVALIALVGLFAYDPTRPSVTGVFIGIGEMILSGLTAISVSPWWQMYGVSIMGIIGLFGGITITALYYKGKIKIWKYGATQASNLVAGRQPAPAPTPTPLSTVPLIVPPVEQKKEATTA